MTAATTDASGNLALDPSDTVNQLKDLIEYNDKVNNASQRAGIQMGAESKVTKAAESAGQ